jgi:hypothetical protein
VEGFYAKKEPTPGFLSIKRNYWQNYKFIVERSQVLTAWQEVSQEE